MSYPATSPKSYCSFLLRRKNHERPTPLIWFETNTNEATFNQTSCIPSRRRSYRAICWNSSRREGIYRRYRFTGMRLYLALKNRCPLERSLKCLSNLSTHILSCPCHGQKWLIDWLAGRYWLLLLMTASDLSTKKYADDCSFEINQSLTFLRLSKETYNSYKNIWHSSHRLRIFFQDLNLFRFSIRVETTEDFITEFWERIDYLASRIVTDFEAF